MKMALAGIRSHHDIRAAAWPRPHAAFMRLALLMLFACGATVQPAAAEPDSNDSKADMLCNMAKFVQWPDAGVAQHKGQRVGTLLGEAEHAGHVRTVPSQPRGSGEPD